MDERLGLRITVLSDVVWWGIWATIRDHSRNQYLPRSDKAYLYYLSNIYASRLPTPWVYINGQVYDSVVNSGGTRNHAHLCVP